MNALPLCRMAALSLGLVVAASQPARALYPGYAARVLATAAGAADPTAAAADSTAHAWAGVDSAVHAAGGVVADSATVSIHTVPDLAGARRMQDTVSVLRGITVEGARKPIGERSTVTATRLDRAAITRFLPSTTSDAMVTAPGVDLVKTGPWASRVSFRGFQG